MDVGKLYHQQSLLFPLTEIKKFCLYYLTYAEHSETVLCYIQFGQAPLILV